MSGDINIQEAHDWLRRLVNIPSHTYAREDVEQAFQFYDELMSHLGMRRLLLPSEDKRFADHRLYLNASASDKNFGTCLVGHIDTVFPRSTGFTEIREDADNFYGPGVLDMKGGLIILASALKAFMKSTPAELQPPISVMVVADEEVGSQDSARLFRSYAPAIKEALVFEGGRKNDDIIVQRKGAINTIITLKGAASHAGNNYFDGISAVHAAALLIPKLEGLTNVELGTTVNVGLITGGTAKNVVPEYCELNLDCRVENQSERERLKAYFEHQLETDVLELTSGSSRAKGTAVSHTIVSERPVMEPTPLNRALADAYLQAQHETGLDGTHAPLQGGGSDACILSAAGVPSIDGLGAYGTGFHSLSEWIDKKSFALKIEACLKFLQARKAEHQTT